MRSILYYVLLWLVLSLLAPLPILQALGSQDEPGCVTDSECAEFCPEGTRDLPADHPDYCDGGPDDGSTSWQEREQARVCRLDSAHCEER